MDTTSVDEYVDALRVLEQVIRDSYTYLKEQDGAVKRVED